MGTSITDLVSNAAITTTIAGNIGVDPFLTVLLVGLIDKFSSSDTAQLVPNDLQAYISSSGAISFWSIVSVLEMIGKCIPVLDEIIDSVEVFVVPAMSILGTLSTFGLYEDDWLNDTLLEGEDGDRRLDESSEDEENGISTSTIRVMQVFVVMLGVGLALSIHLLKILIRLIGQGWLTQLLTVLEIAFCVTTVTISVFVKQFALFMAISFLILMVYSLSKRWKKCKEVKENDEENEKRWWSNWSRSGTKSSLPSNGNESKGISLLPTQMNRVG